MTDSQLRRTSTLLALRDGEPGPAERAGLLADETAKAELEALEDLKAELQALPDPDADPAFLAAIQARAATATVPARQGWRRVPYGLAAGLLLALTAGLVTVGVDREGAAELGPELPGALGMGQDPVLMALYARSRQLEPLAIRSSALAGDPAASALKVRIADVDGQLTAAADGGLTQAEAQRLWGQRVALLESLAEVRRARAAVQPAVF